MTRSTHCREDLTHIESNNAHSEGDVTNASE